MAFGAWPSGETAFRRARAASPAPVLWLRMTDSETEITADLVHDLLQEQHPDLAGLAIREVAGGWDNQQWRLGDELAVRTPRTERAPDLQRKECRWLPVLAPRLPLPVPNPVRTGEPSARFPRPWTIMTWVPGEPLDHASISRGDHAAGTLAGFLRALHVEAPVEAPTSSDRGAHPNKCTDGFDHFFQAVAPAALPTRSGRSGMMPLLPPSGRARRYGCTVTFIPRMSSSRTARCLA